MSQIGSKNLHDFINECILKAKFELDHYSVTMCDTYTLEESEKQEMEYYYAQFETGLK
jgi:hypothetical protein